MNFGIIADGNRRWAKEQNITYSDGHLAGFLAIKNEILPVLEESSTFKTCTIYAFSTENWKRSPFEVKSLMDLFIKVLEDFASELITRKIKLVHVGRKSRLPSALSNCLEKIETESAVFSKFTIYLCIDYGGQDEILRTIKSLSISEIPKLTTEDFSTKLEVPALDIVLRTGGEKRLSNFCLWQSAYAEFFFVDKFLPDIKKHDIEKILNEFFERNRRIGE